MMAKFRNGEAVYWGSGLGNGFIQAGPFDVSGFVNPAYVVLFHNRGKPRAELVSHRMLKRVEPRRCDTCGHLLED